MATRMRDDPENDPLAAISEAGDPDRTSLLPDGGKLVQFSVRLLESKIIEVQAMKAPPKKSALEGDVNASSTAAVANEIFNEIQRDRGGDVVTEDVSRYQVTLRLPPGGLYAGEEMHIELRVEDLTRPDPLHNRSLSKCSRDLASLIETRRQRPFAMFW